jgi:hypothetical protein
MAEPIAARPSAGPRWRIEGWGLAGCELLTLTALLASLASFTPRGHSPSRAPLLPAGSGPRDAFAACARFIGGGAMPDAPGTRQALPRVGSWQWARLDDGRLRVRGYADARSPAGEAHRTYYQCDLVQLSADRWRLDSLAVSARRPT